MCSHRCSHRDLRENAAAYVRGLLIPKTAGNCWALAEAVGHTGPGRLQHLLSGAVWDEDEVRDAVRSFIQRRFGTRGVLVFDETGQLKKGTRTAAVARQYTGTAGRVENAIVAVYTTYATEAGHALIDRDLYVPKTWCTDPERMSAAGFTRDHHFAIKPQLARGQAERAVTVGLEPEWAAGDEFTGARANFASGSNSTGSDTSSRSRSTTASSSAASLGAPTAPRTWFPQPGGTAARPGPGRRGRACTTGHGCSPTRPGGSHPDAYRRDQVESGR